MVEGWGEVGQLDVLSYCKLMGTFLTYHMCDKDTLFILVYSCFTGNKDSHVLIRIIFRKLLKKKTQIKI